MAKFAIAAVLLATLATGPAFAGEAYQDPSDLRTEGPSTDVSHMTMRPLRDQDAYGLRLSGETVDTSHMVMRAQRDQDAFGLRVAGENIREAPVTSPQFAHNLAGNSGGSGVN